MYLTFKVLQGMSTILWNKVEKLFEIGQCEMQRSSIRFVSELWGEIPLLYS
jgi:hypothetical protein